MCALLLPVSFSPHFSLRMQQTDPYLEQWASIRIMGDNRVHTDKNEHTHTQSSFSDCLCHVLRKRIIVPVKRLWIIDKKGLDLDFRPAGAKQEREGERERSSKTRKQLEALCIFGFPLFFASSPSNELNYSTHGILSDGSATVNNSGEHLQSWQLRKSTIQYPSGILWG